MKILVIPSLLIVGLLLSGCISTGSSTNVVTVKVPVVQPWPEPPKIAKPKLAIDSLSATDKKDPAKVSKSLAVTTSQLVTYSNQLSTALDAYRHKTLHRKHYHHIS